MCLSRQGWQLEMGWILTPPSNPSDGGVEWLSRLSATPVPYSYLSFSRKAVSPAQPSQHSVVRGAKRDSLPGPFIKTFSQGKTKEKKIDQTPATGLFFAFINLSFFPSNLNFIFFPPSPRSPTITILLRLAPQVPIPYRTSLLLLGPSQGTHYY